MILGFFTLWYHVMALLLIVVNHFDIFAWTTEWRIVFVIYSHGWTQWLDMWYAIRLVMVQIKHCALFVGFGEIRFLFHGDLISCLIQHVSVKLSGIWRILRNKWVILHGGWQLPCELSVLRSWLGILRVFGANGLYHLADWTNSLTSSCHCCLFSWHS